MADEDPGWSLSWRSALWLLVPRVGIRRMSEGRSGEADGLVLMRQVFLTFCVAIVLIGVVVAFLYSGSEPLPDPSPGPAVGLLVVAAVGVLTARFVEKPLQCEDDVRLAASYRTRFFLRIAFSEAAALLGFVGFFLTYAWWPYPVGGAIAAVGFTRAAPSRRNLARDQDELMYRQCGRSLVSALRFAPPPPSGTR
jgi:F0F1-type ATP synthase membrane subunit c/vacuolar-type H+-ATPase subunit K